MKGGKKVHQQKKRNQMKKKTTGSLHQETFSIFTLNQSRT